LHPIPIPKWKWEVISMDLITIFLRTSKNHDSLMVLVEKLSKVSHFIAVNSTNSISEVAQRFIKEIVRLHGVPKNIV